MDLRHRRRIGVIGGASPEKKWLSVAFEVGTFIAKNNGVLVCGGLGGIMEAAAKGAKQAGGLTLGILPGNSPQDANSFIDIAMATGLGFTRNSLVAMNADALIAINGEYGTLSEIAFGIIHGKKVIGIGTWDIKGVKTVSSAEEAVKLAFLP